MTNDAYLALSAVFGPVWSLFTSWYIPGTRVTPAAAGFLVLGLNLIIRFLKRILEGDDDGRG